MVAFIGLSSLRSNPPRLTSSISFKTECVSSSIRGIQWGRDQKAEAVLLASPTCYLVPSLDVISASQDALYGPEFASHHDTRAIQQRPMRTDRSASTKNLATRRTSMRSYV